MEALEKVGGIDIDGLLKGFNEKTKEKRQQMPPLNIVIIGKTGVGKSTLINAVFGQEVARTGTGRPVTTHCESYTIADSPITIYDSKGIETGEHIREDLEEIYELIKQQNASNNPRQYIHLCWYCINAEGLRIEPNEMDIIKKIREIIPVVTVLTQFAGTPDQKEFFEKYAASLPTRR
ncbi:MAG: 50S ribosome-binding GTPase [Treponema sp.]|nr:50S ribosome-binding GTPase [Treponema sp.]